jgi:CNT family concentrative nucleoside transporter
MSNRSLRLGAAAVALALALLGYLTQDVLDPRLRGAIGAVCFIAIVAAGSSNLRDVNWRTVGWGIALQLFLAFLILKFEAGLRAVQRSR